MLLFVFYASIGMTVFIIVLLAGRVFQNIKYELKDYILYGLLFFTYGTMLVDTSAYMIGKSKESVVIINDYDISKFSISNSISTENGLFLLVPGYNCSIEKGEKYNIKQTPLYKIVIEIDKLD